MPTAVRIRPVFVFLWSRLRRRPDRCESWIDVSRGGIGYGDDDIEVSYEPPVDDYTGNYRDIDSDLHEICVEIGATSYEDMGRGEVAFFFEID